MSKYRDQVTAERVLQLLKYDPATGHLIWKAHRKGQKPPGSIAGTLAQDGYIKVRVDGLSYQAHRLIWLMMTGNWPTEEIDHRDLDKSNNRWGNLRPATHGQNMINVKARRAGMKGAFLDKRRNHWFSAIKIDGKQRRLGTFPSEEAAHRAYASAALMFHGEFYRVN